MVGISDSQIYWKSKRKTVSVKSSGESEYFAHAACGKELSWIRKLFWEMCHQTHWSEGRPLCPIVRKKDNTVAVSMAMADHMTPKHKRIDFAVQKVKELVRNNTIKLAHVSSIQKEATTLTKSIKRADLSRMIDL